MANVHVDCCSTVSQFIQTESATQTQPVSDTHLSNNLSGMLTGQNTLYSNMSILIQLQQGSSTQLHCINVCYTYVHYTKLDCGHSTYTQPGCIKQDLDMLQADCRLHIQTTFQKQPFVHTVKTCRTAPNSSFSCSFFVQQLPLAP